MRHNSPFLYKKVVDFIRANNVNPIAIGSTGSMTIAIVDNPIDAVILNTQKWKDENSNLFIFGDTAFFNEQTQSVFKEHKGNIIMLDGKYKPKSRLERIKWSKYDLMSIIDANYIIDLRDIELISKFRLTLQEFHYIGEQLNDEDFESVTKNLFTFSEKREALRILKEKIYSI
jgi:hypothetical protein